MHFKSSSALGAVLLFLAMGVLAQESRDPTVPPSVGGAMGSNNGTPSTGTEGLSVIVRDGKSHLVVGTRLVAPGQKAGQFKVERITETEVWLREGKELRKLPRFTGIQRSVAKPAPACVAAAKKAKSGKAIKAKPVSNTPPLVAPCEGSQP
jgi:hypothetical protein